MELLKCATFGMSSKQPKGFEKMLFDCENKDHLDRIKKLSKRQDKKICMPIGVARIIDQLGLFAIDGQNIRIHTHFSNAVSNNELVALGNELRAFIRR